MAKPVTDIQRQVWQWDLYITELIYEVMNTLDSFSSDDIWERYRASGKMIPSPFLSKKIGTYLRSMHAAGVILKVNETRTSRRPGNSTLAVFTKNKECVSKGVQKAASTDSQQAH